MAVDRLGLPDTAAARIAGIPLPRFLVILASLRSPVADASDADLDDELAQASRDNSFSGPGAASAAGCPPP
jgi:hypothetical protein